MKWGFHKYKISLGPWGLGQAYKISLREDVLKIRHGSEWAQNVSFLQGSPLISYAYYPEAPRGGCGGCATLLGSNRLRSRDTLSSRRRDNRMDFISMSISSNTR